MFSCSRGDLPNGQKRKETCKSRCLTLNLKRTRRTLHLHRHMLLMGCLLVSSCSQNNNAVSFDPPTEEEAGDRRAEEALALQGLKWPENFYMGIASNPEILAADSLVEEAVAELAAANVMRWPNVSLGARTDPDMVINPQLYVEQPVWTAGRINNSIAIAKANIGIRVQERDQIVNRILSEALVAFSELRSSEKRTEIIRASIERHALLEARVERLYEADSATVADLELARVRRLELSRLMSEVQIANMIARSKLAQIVGSSILSIERLFEERQIWPTLDAEKTAVQAVIASPEIRRAELEIQVLERERSIEKSNGVPNISLQYQADESDQNMGIALNWNISTTLLGASNRKAAEKRESGARHRASALRRDLRVQVENIINEYHSLIKIMSSAEKISMASEDILEVYSRQAVAGKRSWLELINAEREADSTKINEVNVKVSAQLSLMRIALISGRVFDSGKDWLDDE